MRMDQKFASLPNSCVHTALQSQDASHPSLPLLRQDPKTDTKWTGFTFKEHHSLIVALSESVSIVSDSMTPWTVAHQFPLSKGLSRQEYWTRLQFLPPGDLPDLRTEPASLESPSLHADSFLLSYLGTPSYGFYLHLIGLNLEMRTHMAKSTCLWTQSQEGELKRDPKNVPKASTTDWT